MGQNMKKYKVVVTLKKEVSDPQGAVIAHSLQSLGHSGVKSVRCGKYFELEVPDDWNEDNLETVCREVLSNPVIEEYQIHSAEKK